MKIQQTTVNVTALLLLIYRLEADVILLKVHFSKFGGLNAAFIKTRRLSTPRLRSDGCVRLTFSILNFGKF